MIKTFSILLSVMLCAVCTAVSLPETDEIDAEIARILNDFGVQVHYRYEGSRFFPEKWLQPSLALSATEIDLGEVTRLLPLIRRFLASHPIDVVDDHLENIYLLKALSFFGKPYGSTYSDKSIYIVSNGLINRYDDDFICCRMHSEFSSILFKTHPFPTSRWLANNPSGFTYSGSGFEMVDNSSCYDSTVRSCTDGFLFNYSRSSLENDFNMISSWLFTKKAELDALSQQYEGIRQKQFLSEQFYQSISVGYVFN